MKKKDLKRNGEEQIMKCYYGKYCDRVFCRNDHGGNNLQHLDYESIKEAIRNANNNKKGTRSILCKLGNQCPKANCLFLHERKACGGFKVCKKG